MSNVTFFLTSCKRHDLLKICLESFEKYNTYPIERGIIIEDSDMDIEWCRDILKSIPNLELIKTGGRQGQIRNIDRCYATIDTEYVFHCEDDFEFLMGNFIEPSITILENEPNCINTWLTGYDPVWHDSSHPSSHIIPKDYAKIENYGITYWPVNNPIIGEYGLGFTFQPSLHRINDWKKYNGYENIVKNFAPWANLFDGGQTERNLARFYITEGYHTRMLAGPNCHDTGWLGYHGGGRHVPLPSTKEL